MRGLSEASLNQGRGLFRRLSEAVGVADSEETVSWWHARQAHRAQVATICRKPLPPPKKKNGCEVVDRPVHCVGVRGGGGIAD